MMHLNLSALPRLRRRSHVTLRGARMLVNLNAQHTRSPSTSLADVPDAFGAARAVHAHLAKLNVRHAFCGAVGLAIQRAALRGAVDVIGGVRCPQDIDVLLGEEAFDIEHDVVIARCIPVLASGVRVHALPALGAWQQLLAEDAVARIDALPVLSLHAIIAMKLSGKSVRDDADIVALLSSASVDVAACAEWLRERRFDMTRFDRLLQRVR